MLIDSTCLLSGYKVTLESTHDILIGI